MELLFIIELVSAVICIIVGISTYKTLMRGRASVQEGWSAIEVQLQRRINLIPNLVETARVHAGHEQQTLENVTNALTMLQNAPGPTGAAQADNMLASALHALFAVADANPNLQADKNYRNWQHHLADTEDKIRLRRDFYNARVMGFNIKVRASPARPLHARRALKRRSCLIALYTVSGRRISELAETQQAAIAAPEAESEHESHSHYSRDMHDAEWGARLRAAALPSGHGGAVAGRLAATRGQQRAGHRQRAGICEPPGGKTSRPYGHGVRRGPL